MSKKRNAAINRPRADAKYSPCPYAKYGKRYGGSKRYAQ